MRILVTGATGFIGNHVCNHIIKSGHELIATGRSLQKANSYDWFEKAKFVEFDLNNWNETVDLYDYFSRPEAVIHLAWEGLPNYNQLFHIESNLFRDYYFLKNLISNGLTNLTVTGSCLEYGMQGGELHEEMPSFPQNPYALAKDSLRKFLDQLANKTHFNFKWVRLFYLTGEYQSESSIIPLLKKTIARGETEFKMSGGEQLRDYLPATEVARYLVAAAVQKNITGIINCCSGHPISIRRLVENYLEENPANISLKLGYYPYPDYEPMAFWGNTTKLKRIL